MAGAGYKKRQSSERRTSRSSAARYSGAVVFETTVDQASVTRARFFGDCQTSTTWHPAFETTRVVKGYRIRRGSVAGRGRVGENPDQTLARRSNDRNRLTLKDFWSGKRDSNSRPQPWQGCASHHSTYCFSLRFCFLAGRSTAHKARNSAQTIHSLLLLI